MGAKGFGRWVQGCFYVRADRPNNSQLPLIVGNAACRAGKEAKTYKTFWPKVFEAGLFARSGYQPISHQLTPHTRGVAVGGAALTVLPGATPQPLHEVVGVVVERSAVTYPPLVHPTTKAFRV